VSALDANSMSRLQLVMPSLAAKIIQMHDILESDPQPIKLIVIAGMRTWAQQDALYAQGRTVPGKIVTDARGGESWHNMGCAADCAPEVIDGTIDWNPSHPQWKRMEAVGMSLGLTSGATWVRLVDAPHFQYTGRFPTDAPDDEARQIWELQGQAAFWLEVGP
jgi:peptidoglycan LD-endopeptidase CwlK